MSTEPIVRNLNNDSTSLLFAHGLIHACETAALTLRNTGRSYGLKNYQPLELAVAAYGTWCMASALGWAEARRRVAADDWTYQIEVLRKVGVVVPVASPEPRPSHGWFNTNSHAELADLIAKEPWRIMRLLNVRCCIVSTWDAELWPVGTEVQVVSVEYTGEWGVVLEALDIHHMDRVWKLDPDATPTPFITIGKFFKQMMPLKEDL